MLRYVRFALLALIVAVIWMLVLPPAPVAQPLPFNHAKHAPMGCVVCHAGVETGARAGLPKGQVCVNCHATPPPVSGAEVAWREIERGRFRWVQVTEIPDHVKFSHRRHTVLARLECTSCHGDVGSRSTPPRRLPMRLDMDACLSCHKQEGSSEECAACHR